MGVKHFYLWYSRNFRSCLSSQPQHPIDVLALDLNGLFHPVAQKVFEYGNHAPPPSLLCKRRPNNKSTLDLFKEVCEKIEYCRNLCKPRKKLILCVDGVAGLGKMNQQRQRRFRTAKSISETPNASKFNPNAFTPGTRLMDHLTKYIDWYIRSMISFHPEWKNLEVVFSNEKVPGEGEHKIMQYIRDHGSSTETYCIYGLDADLIMLGMMLPVDKVLIAREAEEGIVQYVDIQSFKREILNLMRWDSGSRANPTASFSEKHGVHDFILLCFLVGNDFLPTVPSLTIIDGGIDHMMNAYKDIGSVHGHLTRVNRNGELVLRSTPLSDFFSLLGQKEKSLIEEKYKGRISFFPDPLVLKHLGTEGLDMEGYKRDYYEKNLSGVSIQNLVSSYLDGMHWVLNYYKHKMPDWLWFFPYLYGPFLSDFCEVLKEYKAPSFQQNQPVAPFLQLMVVLPSSSSDLVPVELTPLMTSETSPLQKYYPKEFEIDLAGKKKDWEGIVLLPPITIDDFFVEYRNHIKSVKPSCLKRNIKGKSFVYRYHDESPNTFMSFYGAIQDCRVNCEPLSF
jgi:5'-3' exoribonuclease 1